MSEEIVDNDPVPSDLLDGETVLEAGAYEGAWALKVCAKRPNCKVVAFEPATRAYKMALEKLKECPNVDLRCVALGKADGQAVLCDRLRDGANTFDHNPESQPSETVPVVDVAEVVRGMGEIALAHLNAEGDEVTILERLLEANLIGQFKTLLVQWHPYDDGMRARIEAITEHLSETHDYERRGPWGCWKRKVLDGGARLPRESRGVQEVPRDEGDSGDVKARTETTETVRKKEEA